MEVTSCCLSRAWRHCGQRGLAGIAANRCTTHTGSAVCVAHPREAPCHRRARMQEWAMAEALYALEKLADAVAALATGSGRVRDRLFEASTYLIRVRPEDIPDEDLRHTFIGVMDDDL